MIIFNPEHSPRQIVQNTLQALIYSGGPAEDQAYCQALLELDEIQDLSGIMSILERKGGCHVYTGNT